MSTLHLTNISNISNSIYIPINTIVYKEAYANFYYSVNDAAGSLTISSSDTYGTQMLFNKTGSYKNIILNTSNSNWTHAHTGTYRLYTAYRQASGDDIWTVLGVTKNGNSQAVGVSARTGSENSHNENYTIIYTVDDTSATYQLQHWSNGSKTVLSDFTNGQPGWTNYSTLVGNTTGDTGRMVDYYIERLGD